MTLTAGAAVSNRALVAERAYGAYHQYCEGVRGRGAVERREEQEATGGYGGAALGHKLRWVGDVLDDLRRDDDVVCEDARRESRASVSQTVRWSGQMEMEGGGYSIHEVQASFRPSKRCQYARFGVNAGK